MESGEYENNYENKKACNFSLLTKEKVAIAKQIFEKKYSNGRLLKLGQKGQKMKYLNIINRRKKPKDFKKISVIGRGAFGEVRLVEEIKTGKIFAMKLMRKDEMVQKNQIGHVRSERDLMVYGTKDGGEKNNPWIVQLEYSFQDEEYLYLVMDYLPGGDMMTWLISQKIFSEDETRFYIAELVLAVDSIHKLEFVHRDLKPDNILLDKQGHIKLSDFGLSKPYSGSNNYDKEYEIMLKQQYQQQNDDDNDDNNQEYEGFDSLSRKQKMKSWKKKGRELLWSTVGSNGYIAPEVLLKKGYGFECDWWSVGIIMYEMLCGFPPFYDKNPIRACHKIVRFREFLEFPDDIEISNQAKDLIQQFITDSKHRIGINGVKEIKNHPFFKGIQWNKIRQCLPPFIPQLKSETDCSYFDHFEDNDIYKTIKNQNKHINLLHEKNYVFYGFTFNKQFSGFGSDKKKQIQKKKAPSVINFFPQEQLQQEPNL